MRPPTDGEWIKCPQSKSGKLHKPESVYDGINPDGKPAPRGILAKHRHGWTGPDCDYSGFPVDVVGKQQKETMPLSAESQPLVFDPGIFVNKVPDDGYVQIDELWVRYAEIADMLVGCD